MDTFPLSIVPELLTAREATDRLLQHLKHQLFQELDISEDRRGNVDFRYLNKFWHLRVYPPVEGYRRKERLCVSIQKTLNSEELEDGAGVDDRGVVIDGYTVFKMDDGDTVDLLVLNTFLERKL